MKKLLLAILLISSTIGYSQIMNDIMKEVFDDAEFFLLSEDYPDALSSYMKLYKRGYESNANINYKIGICYLNIAGEKNNSIQYLEKAVKNLTDNYKEGTLKENKAPIDAYIFLGNAYRINDELELAMESYNKFLEKADAKATELITYTKKQIEACKKARELKANPLNLKINNLGENINTSSSNFRPVIAGDESVLVYMNELKFYDAVFYSEKKNGQWMIPRNITPEIRSDGDQYTTGISSDGKILFLAKEDF
ncbi:MAG: tetratricopeptide repeat protein, partial [bacterium]